MTNPSPAGIADSLAFADDDTSTLSAFDADRQDDAAAAAEHVHASASSGDAPRTSESSLVAVWRGLEQILRNILQSIQRIEQAGGTDGSAANPSQEIDRLRQTIDQALAQSANRQRDVADRVENRIIRLLARLDIDAQDSRAQFNRIERATKAVEERVGTLSVAIDRMEREMGGLGRSTATSDADAIPALVQRVRDLERRLADETGDFPSPQSDLKAMLAEIMAFQKRHDSLAAAE